VSSQQAEVIIVMGTTLWTDEISGIDGIDDRVDAAVTVGGRLF